MTVAADDVALGTCARGHVKNAENWRKRSRGSGGYCRPCEAARVRTARGTTEAVRMVYARAELPVAPPCAGQEELFDDKTTFDAAIALCHGCPVQQACYSNALSAYTHMITQAGVWWSFGKPYTTPPRTGPKSREA